MVWTDTLSPGAPSPLKPEACFPSSSLRDSLKTGRRLISWFARFSYQGEEVQVLLVGHTADSGTVLSWAVLSRDSLLWSEPGQRTDGSSAVVQRRARGAGEAKRLQSQAVFSSGCCQQVPRPAMLSVNTQQSPFRAGCPTFGVSGPHWKK